MEPTTARGGSAGDTGESITDGSVPAPSAGQLPRDPGSPRAGELHRLSGLDRFFSLTERGSNVRTEVVAGLSLLLAVAYAVVVVPGQLAKAGVPLGPVTTAVVLAIALATLVMGLYANLPVALAPGLGGVALVAVTLLGQQHVPWPTAMGMVFWSGVAFLLLSLFGARERLLRLIPEPVKHSISAGLGLFIALLGFRDAGLVRAGPNGTSLVLGHLDTAAALLTLAGLAVLTALMSRRVLGAYLMVIVLVALAGIPLGLTRLPAHLVTPPAGLGPIAFHLDLLGALAPRYLPYLFAFFISEVFSATATLFAVSSQAGLTDEHGNVANGKRPFVTDSVAVLGGAAVGAPSMTPYLESVAAADSGGRTGLTSVVAALGFVALLPFTAVAGAIPQAATAPVLIYVGLRLLAALRRVDFTEPTDAIPAALTVAATVFFGNFGTAIALGLVAYPVVKVLAGRVREVPRGLWLVMIPLAYYFYTLAR